MITDILKGTIPVLIAKLLDASPATVGFTALAAVIGHMYPVFFDFKGGKGVATAIGALLGFHFLVGVLVAATWLLVAKFSRYSSLASITAVGFSPFYSLLLIQRLDIFPPIFIMALLVLYKHKDNIVRLIDKKEPKIKLKNNVINDIMQDEPPEAVTPVRKTEASAPEVAIEVETITITETVVTPPKATKTTKTTKTTTKKAESPEKKAKPAKKATAPKVKTKKPPAE